MGTRLFGKWKNRVLRVFSHTKSSSLFEEQYQLMMVWISTCTRVSVWISRMSLIQELSKFWTRKRSARFSLTALIKRRRTKWSQFGNYFKVWIPCRSFKSLQTLYWASSCSQPSTNYSKLARHLIISKIIAGKIAVTVKNPYYKDPNSQECTFLTAKVSGLGSALKM